MVRLRATPAKRRAYANIGNARVHTNTRTDSDYMYTNFVGGKKKAIS